MHQKIINSYGEFSKGRRTESQLKQDMLEHIYDWAVRRNGIGPEGAGEFALSVLARIPKIIQGYDPSKGNLISYLTTCYKNHVRLDYTKKFRKKTIEEAMVYQHPKEPLWGCLHDRKSSYKAEQEDFDKWLEACKIRIASLPEARQPVARRRLLCLFLYHGVYLPPNRVKDIADICHVNLEKLNGWLKQLVEELDEKLSKLKYLKEHLNKSYTGLRTYQWMNQKDCSIYNKQEIERKIHFYSTRVKSSQRKLIEMQLFCSQGSIAKMIDMPTGTVSSSIYYARKLLSPLTSELLSL